MRVAARERERQERESSREHQAAVRRAEAAKRESARLSTQLDKAAAAEQKRLEKESRESHVAAMESEVAAKNAELARVYEEIDSLLAATLALDDYVDLQTLRTSVVHPPFDRADLEVPIPPPAEIADPPKPKLAEPPPPSGLASLFGKKKHAEAVEHAQREHERALQSWREACTAFAARREKALEVRQRAEAKRLEVLAVERQRYERECDAREIEAKESNLRLESLIASLGYGMPEAIQEYVSIVLSNSVYPEHFEVSHEFAFEPATAELRLRVVVPAPGVIPEIKAYKYAKATDEIVSTALSQKECRERYAGAIHQVALRSFHEVFEADRRGLIKTISLEVGTHATDPSTGRAAWIPFVVAAAERESFLQFELAAVVPALTLGKLGAAVSKNPYGLVAAERAGVRRS
jgi:restriction system protein